MATEKPAMPKALATFFDTHRAATGEKKRAVHDALDPILDVCADAEQHLLDLETKLGKAELAAHDHATDGTTQWMHTRIADARLRTTDLRSAGRALARAMVELENGFEQSEIDIANVLTARAEQGKPVEPVTPVVEAKP